MATTPSSAVPSNVEVPGSGTGGTVGTMAISCGSFNPEISDAFTVAPR
jgi:hypothetical protein